MTTIRRGLALAALVPLLTGLAACGGSDNDKDDSSNNASVCGTLPTADPAATLPAGFPTRDQVLYEPSTQGATKVVYALVDESDFVEVRDDLVDKLKAAGYTIEGTDQESVEAEAEFSGAHKGTIKVEPKCTGYVTVRYKFEG